MSLYVYKNLPEYLQFVNGRYQLILIVKITIRSRLKYSLTIRLPKIKVPQYKYLLVFEQHELLNFMYSYNYVKIYLQVLNALFVSQKHILRKLTATI